MVDEISAADTNYYFPEPKYYRVPSNTDQVFEEYCDNPDLFEEFEIPKDFLAIRYNDLKNELRQIQLEGGSSVNRKKYYYYKGMVDKLNDLINKDKDIGQDDLVMEYNDLQRGLKFLRESDTQIGKIHRYYYWKGHSIILKQILLNTPLMPKVQQ